MASNTGSKKSNLSRGLAVFAGGLVFALLLAACAPSTRPAEPTAAAIPSSTIAPTQTSAPSPTVPAEVSFSTDILPVLTSRCGSCHGGQRIEEGLDLFSYASVMAGSEKGPVVIPGDAAASKLAIMVGEGKMPKRGPKLTPAQVQMIIDWINSGAQNN